MDPPSTSSSPRDDKTLISAYKNDVDVVREGSGFDNVNVRDDYTRGLAAAGDGGRGCERASF